jgi:hypothetical protein
MSGKARNTALSRVTNGEPIRDANSTRYLLPDVLAANVQAVSQGGPNGSPRLISGDALAPGP